MQDGRRGCVRIEKKPQISPLRCAPVEMTNLLHGKSSIIQWMHARPWPNKFVISTGVVMGLRSTQGDEKRFGPATTLYGTVALPFVIPSAAEGSTVPRTLPGNVFRPSVAEWRDLRFPPCSHTPSSVPILIPLFTPTKEAAEKPEFFEGDGLQAVHNCFVVSAALAAEGAVFLQPGLLPQPLKSLFYRPDPKLR